MRRTGGRPQGVLVGRQQDTSGDYGYDLAHEATGRSRTPENPTGGAEGESPEPDLTADLGQDLGYDEAHGF